MRKKVLSAVLAATMVAGMMGNVVSVSAEEKYDLTLYSVNTTDPDFDDWLANVEEATGLNINVIAAPTDTDTRQQKITTILSTGDSSVDIVEINDEMSAAFKNSGWLEGLNDTVMTDDIIDQFAQGYIQDMITDKDGNIVGVPGYTGYLAFWVNQEIMDEVGIESIDTKEDFMKYMEAVSKDGRFGYGGSWEKTYASNEIAQFVNMFGGDYFDWTKEENKEAIQFLHDLVLAFHECHKIIGYIIVINPCPIPVPILQVRSYGLGIVGQQEPYRVLRHIRVLNQFFFGLIAAITADPKPAFFLRLKRILEGFRLHLHRPRLFFTHIGKR